MTTSLLHLPISPEAVAAMVLLTSGNESIEYQIFCCYGSFTLLIFIVTRTSLVHQHLNNNVNLTLNMSLWFKSLKHFSLYYAAAQIRLPHGDVTPLGQEAMFY